MNLTKLNAEDCVTVFKNYMDKLFKKDDQTEAYVCYVLFDSFRRKPKQKLQDFLIEFDKLYNRSASRDMKLPSTVLAFKLLDAAGLSKTERSFVLTGMDFSKKEQLYEQAQEGTVEV